MHTAVIFLIIGGKKRRKLDDMHVIIIGAQSPVAIWDTIYGADNVFILVKRSVFCGTILNLFPEFLRKISSGRCIVISICCSLFLAGEIKGHIANFDVPIA